MNATSLAELDADALEGAELDAARAAPRRPLVDDDRVPAQRASRAASAGAPPASSCWPARAARPAAPASRRAPARCGELERPRLVGALEPAADLGQPDDDERRRRRRRRGRTAGGASWRTGVADRCGSARQRSRYPVAHEARVPTAAQSGTSRAPPGSRGPRSVVRAAGPLAARSVSKSRAFMADPTSVAVEAASIPDLRATIARAEKFMRERFLHDGEDAAVALAPGSARRRALDDALAELERRRQGPVDRVAPRVLAAARPRARAQRGRAEAWPTARCSTPTRSTPSRAP